MEHRERIPTHDCIIHDVVNIQVKKFSLKTWLSWVSLVRQAQFLQRPFIGDLLQGNAIFHINMISLGILCSDIDITKRSGLVSSFMDSLHICVKLPK